MNLEQMEKEILEKSAALLKEARKQYKERRIEIVELTRIFNMYCSEEEYDAYRKTPLFDKSNYIAGKSQAEMDREWRAAID